MQDMSPDVWPVERQNGAALSSMRTPMIEESNQAFVPPAFASKLIRKMTVRGLIAYDRTGDGPPIVFVHGLTYDRGMWEPVIEKLNGSFTCVNIDLPGHGESLDAGTYGLEWVVRAV